MRRTLESALASNDPKRWPAQGLTLAVAAVLFCIFLLPSILLNQWFPLDLGGTFEIGDRFREKWSWIVSPYNGSGRYFPFYWIFNSFQYFFFGTHVLPYYLVQSVIILAAILLTCRTLKEITGTSKFSVWLLVLLFFNSPLAENSATLGKAEPLSYLLVILVIFIFVRAESAGRRLVFREQLYIALLFFLALLTKETSLALVGFAATGVVLVESAKRLRGPEAPYLTSKAYFQLLSALVAGWGVTKIPYLIYWDPTDRPTYLDYKVTASLIRSNLEFYAQQQPDVLVFAGLALFALALTANRLYHHRSGPAFHKQFRAFIIVVSLYAMAAAYYLVLLAWRWPMAYYMLLPSVIFRLVAVYGLVMFADQLRSQRIGRAALYGVAGVTLAHASAYIFYIVSSQIAYSRLYTEALQKYIAGSSGSALVMETYPFYAEQVTGSHLLLLIATGRRFRVAGISDLLEGDASSS
jgi:hypothetical protein